MRTPTSFLVVSLLAAAPAVAHAQYYYYRPAQVVNARPVVVVQPAPIYVPPPPPPVYVVQAPAPIVVAAPAPVVAAAPVAVVAKPAKPQFTSRFGLSVVGEGVFDLTGLDSKGWGILGELRFRTARHLGFSLTSGYDRAETSTGFRRIDVPLMLGMMVYFLGPEAIISPYVVGAAGLNFANVEFMDTPSLKIRDERTQAMAQLGGGLELRLGQHFAFNLDARYEGRWNLDDPSKSLANASEIEGRAVKPIESSSGLRVGLGASVYF